MTTIKKIGVIGIPYNVGWKGEGIDEAPAALRKASLLGSLRSVADQAVDLGDVRAELPPHDESNPKLKNPAQVIAVSKAVASKLAPAVKDGIFPLILGGEDGVLMGIIEGFRQGLEQKLGMIYLDAHADFNTPETTPSGLIGGMNVAIVTGRGSTELTKIFGRQPQLPEENIVLFGVRDLDPLEKVALDASMTTLVTREMIRKHGAANTMRSALRNLEQLCDIIYMQMDVDVLDPTVLAAQTLPVPDGLSIEECSEALKTVMGTGKLCGFAVTVFNPRKDPDGTEAKKLIKLILNTLGS